MKNVLISDHKTGHTLSRLYTKIITRVVIPQHILNHLEKIYDKAISKQWKIFLAAE